MPEPTTQPPDSTVDVSDANSPEDDGTEPVPPDPYAMETPFDCFKRPNVRELLMQHPTTRPYSLDSGFLASVDKVASLDSMKDQQAMASIVMNDPRLTQAMAALQGWGLTVTEKEAKKAESVGDMPKRDAIQMPHYEYAHTFTTPQAAKDAGNAAFKEGRYPEALACWGRVRHLYGQLIEKGPEAMAELNIPLPEPSLPTTLHSNAAAALLKLERPDEALRELEGAIKAAPPGHDLSKVYHRQAQAHEAKALKLINPEKGAAEWSLALECGRTALTAAKDAEQSQQPPQQPQGSSSPRSSSKEVQHLQREVKRLKEAEKAAKAKADAAREQSKRVEQAEARRAKGVIQEAPKPEASPTNKKDGAIVNKPAHALANSHIGYVRDIDLSTFATGWLGREVVECAHKWGDGEIRVSGLEASQCDIHVSIKEKRGKRALYYDLTLVMRWSGKSKLGRGKDSYGTMEGILKMYNIGQDTKFELGGDKETSYMYELGMAPQYHGACDPWATQLKEKAAELFEEVALMINKKFVPAVEKKGELVQ